MRILWENSVKWGENGIKMETVEKLKEGLKRKKNERLESQNIHTRSIQN